MELEVMVEIWRQCPCCTNSSSSIDVTTSLPLGQEFSRSPQTPLFHDPCRSVPGGEGSAQNSHNFCHVAIGPNTAFITMIKNLLLVHTAAVLDFNEPPRRGGPSESLSEDDNP